MLSDEEKLTQPGVPLHFKGEPVRTKAGRNDVLNRPVISKSNKGIKNSSVKDEKNEEDLPEQSATSAKLTERENVPAVKGLPTPSEIFDKLSEYVIGQVEAKKTISVAAVNHLKRTRLNDPTLKRSNIMLIGPTGCGKTHIVSSLAKVLDVPFVSVPSTDFSPTGICGRDISDMLLDLVKAAHGVQSKAEKGIIFIDEVDKLIHRTGRSHDAGPEVQQAMLTILDGTKAHCLIDPFHSAAYRTIDTSGILFIFGGAFPALYDIIRKRLGDDNRTFSEDQLFASVTAEDLCSFGLIPEFVGRIPAIASLEKLKAQDYVRILTEVKGALTVEYKKLFAADGVKLEFTKSALEKVANRAVTENRGARGLRTIFEDALKDAQFLAPSLGRIANVKMMVEPGCGKRFLSVTVICNKNNEADVQQCVQEHSKRYGVNFNVQSRG